MKKSLALTLAFVFVFGIAGMAFASPSPFVDVPADHWAYAAVSKLVKAGIVDGMGDGTFQGNKSMTRYEMAQIVGKLMVHSDKATAENKALIDKLAAEFSNELEAMGVRVTSLEKRVGTVKVTGEVRLRYENTDNSNQFDYVPVYQKVRDPLAAQTVKHDRPYHFEQIADTYVKSPVANSNGWPIRTRIHLNAQLKNDWTFYGRIENNQNLNTSGNTDKENQTDLNNIYLSGPAMGTQMTVGRFDYVPVYGVVADSTLDGVKFSFGNQLKATVMYGKEDNKYSDIVDYNYEKIKGMFINDRKVYKQIPVVKNDDVTYTGVELKYGLNANTNILGAWHQFEAKDANIMEGLDNTKLRVWEAGFDSKLSQDFGFKASYAKSNADNDNKGYFGQLTYKGADTKKEGTYGMWVNYRNLKKYATWDSTFDLAGIGAAANSATYANQGMKGYEVGVNYTIIPDMLLTAKYVDGKANVDDVNKDNKVKYYQAQVEFFF